MIWNPKKSYLAQPTGRVLNVETPENQKDGQKDIREMLQVREGISVMDMRKDSLGTQASLDKREFALERDTVHVMSVATLIQKFTMY